jgi:3-methyladenine DNA glycosylase AlkD
MSRVPTATEHASVGAIREVRRALAQRADPDKAAPMQAYMKSAMPFLGVQSTEMRAACREAFGARPLVDLETWRDTVLRLWRGARYREERYAAIELTGYRRYDDYQRTRVLPMYAELVTTGAWWDLVDPIATQRLWKLLERHPATMARRMRTWSAGRDIWKRRCSILCQLKLKTRTDTDLLTDCIRPSMAEPEFFLRKAIGWALREYAKTDPAWVIRFVRERRNELSALSKREALRNLDVSVP